MPTLNKVWFAMRTRTATNTSGDPQTDSPIGLVINENGIDRLNHIFSEDTPQKDQEAGQANLYSVDADVETDELDNSSVRVSNLGGDQWSPEVLYIWGEGRRFADFNTEIIPVAIETDIITKLSAGVEDRSAVPSMPLRLVAKGNRRMQIRRLMLIVMTEGVPHTGIIAHAHAPSETNDPIELEITNASGLVVKYEVPKTPQLDLERGQANLYFVPASVPFSQQSLRQNSIVLRIKGDDAWQPSKVFLFGLDDAAGRPESMVPLVHISQWNLGWLSTDTGEGREEIILPLIQEQVADEGLVVDR